MKLLLSILCVLGGLVGFLGSPLSAQCAIQLRGTVLDRATGEPLPYANVFAEEPERGTLTDSEGNFYFQNLCTGDLHVEVSHLGCTPERVFLTLDGDTTLRITLLHYDELLDEVVVHGESTATRTANGQTTGRSEILRQHPTDLAALTERMTGVSSLRNGAGIGKPSIHGLYGNRVAIINNGLVHAGQQWGVDHAPEIDPLAADHITVVKGTAALEYGGNALGGLLLVEPGLPPSDPHPHGAVQYAFQTNGRGHGLNAELEGGKTWQYRLTQSLKLHGDRRTPDYLLNNTGSREAATGLHLTRRWNDRWTTRAHYAYFAAALGILRGAQLSNLTDLEAALARSVPFFTEPRFSYALEPPRQGVEHHLWKLEADLLASDRQLWRVHYGGQWNRRREFDQRRGGRDETPALSLSEYTHEFGLKLQQQLAGGGQLKTGLQFRLTDNANVPGTGVLPLIPNYEAYRPAGYLVWQREAGDWNYEAGLRYEWAHYDVRFVSFDLPRRFLDAAHTFHNPAAGGGVRYQFDRWHLTGNVGYRHRAPEINELYSNGLHQGVAGIERGDAGLRSERSLKTTLGATFTSPRHWTLEVLGYWHRIADYIYLQPQPEPVLTIRGAFPEFRYRQTNARLLGTDLNVTYRPVDSWRLRVSYALVHGRQDDGTALPFLPPANGTAEVRFQPRDNHGYRNAYFSGELRWYAEQGRTDLESELVPPPPGYTLLNFAAGTELRWGKQSFEVSVRMDNALNTTYRDYLNRLRIFADELGRNVSVRVRVPFGG